MSIKHHTPRSPFAEACITKFAAALPSSLPPPPKNIKEFEGVLAQRVVNAIEAIAIYKTKTNMARKSMSQTGRQEDKVAKNANNRRKWEGNHNGSSSQQNKGHKVPKAHTTKPINKKAYVDLNLCATSANFTKMDCAL
ncbi:hypothetical protein Tco_1212730 [Tanacetum coccineum]